ncbi:AsmA family protein [Thalassovita sp.]|jgi:AsmA protein|uniref:AsmA family protein n=1 Tax=Thalassovita sp. TaxID=1979401 RepID=UPI003B5A7B91
MRFLIRLIGFVLVLVLVAVVGLLMLPGERIAKVAADQLKAQTGREVVLSGETKVSYYPVLGVSTGPITIANADWSKGAPLMRAEGLKVGVDLVSLLSGEVRITGLEAVAPDILLERAKDGRVNWDTGVSGVAASGQPAGSSNPLALSLDRALIQRGKLRYVDHGTGVDVSVRDVSADLRWPDYDGRGDFDLSATYGDTPLALKGHVGSLADVLAGKVTEITAELAAKGGRIEFQGRGASQPQLQGRVKADISDSGAFLAALDVKGANLPRGLGRTVKLGADVTLTQAQMLSIRDLSATLDQNAFTGEMDLDLAKQTPLLTARIATKHLDLSGLDTGGSGPSANVGWSKARIDASALGLMNGEIAFDAGGLGVSGLTFGTTRARITIDRARAVAQLSQLSGYGGTITGRMVANNRSGLSVGGALNASGLDMQNLLSDVAGITRFTGSADANLEYLGVGNSTHAIMNSLSGKGSLTMGRGTIQGIDLDKLMRSGLGTGGTTVFDSLTASFTMKDGNLFNPDLLMKLPALSANGEGRIGLGPRDLDYLFTPQIDSINGGKGLAIPVRIKGPWSSPRITPDMEKAIDLNFEEEKEKARKKLEDEVNKRLGVEKEVGESTEDAIKRKLEDEVRDKVRKMFE